MYPNCSNPNASYLTRKEALEEGVAFDLAEIEAAKGLPEQLCINIPLAITYAAYSESFDYRQMLLALKSVLRFALHQGETIFKVPVSTPDLEFIWLRVLREIEEDHPVLTIMMLDEGRSNLIGLRQ
jgi:hypothetical protein